MSAARRLMRLRSSLVPARALGVAPRATRAAVPALDVAKAPVDLSGGAVEPIRPGARHLRTRIGLRNAIRPARAAGMNIPMAFAIPQVDQAAKLRVGVEAVFRQQRLGDPL